MKIMRSFFLFILVAVVNLVEASYECKRPAPGRFETHLGDIVCYYSIIRPPDQTNKKEYDEHMAKVEGGEFVDFAQFTDLRISGFSFIDLSSYRIISACRNVIKRKKIVNAGHDLYFEYPESKAGYFIERKRDQDSFFTRCSHVYNSKEKAFDALLRSHSVQN